VTRNAEWNPDTACAREWQPVEAPKRRRDPKREDEPVQRSSPVADDASAPDPAARAHDTQDRDDAERPDRGDVELDSEGQDG